MWSPLSFFFQAEDGIRDRFTWLEFRRVLFRSCSIQAEFMLKTSRIKLMGWVNITQIVTWKDASKDKLWLTLIAIQCWLSIHHEFIFCFTPETIIGDGKINVLYFFFFWCNVVAKTWSVYKYSDKEVKCYTWCFGFVL